MLRRLFVFLFIIMWCLIIPQFINAQIKIQGTVTDRETKESLPNVIIKIIATDTDKTLISYTMSDKNGSYELSFQSTDEVVDLEFSLLGYQKVTKRIPAKSGTYNQSLSFSATQLKEVTVKAPHISSYGDTINYRVSAFIKKTDRNVEDILRKLPGITVQKNGQIEYQGKPINKFYIEGLDMLEGKYNLATKNIAADQITNVQVYENHQPVRLLKNIDYSENAAINIKLKNKKMNRPVGNILAGGAYDGNPLYLGELFGFMANAKNQLLFTLKGNNAGVNNRNELLDFYGNNNKNVKVEQYILSLPFIVPSMVEERTKNTSNLSTSLNMIRKLNDRSSIKFDLSYLQSYKQYQRKSTSYYYTNQKSTIINEDIDASLKQNEVSGGIVYELNSDSLYIKNATNGGLNFSDSFTNIYTGNSISQKYDIKKVTFSNAFSLMWQRANNVYNLQSIVSGGVIPNNKLNIYKFNDETGALQQNLGKSLYSLTSTSFTKGFNAHSNLGIDISVETEYDNISTDLDNYILKLKSTNKNNGYKITSTINPTYNYDRGSFYLTINAPFRYFNINYKGDSIKNNFKYNKPFLSPKIRIKYVVSPAFFVTALAGLNSSTGDIMSFVLNPIQKSYNYISYGESGILAQQQSLNTSCGYNYKNTMKGLFSYFNLSYARIKRNILSGNNISEQGTISSLATGTTNYADNYLANLYLAKNVHSIQTTFALTSSYNYSKNQKIRQNNKFFFSNQILSIFPSINFNAIDWLSIRMMGDISIFSQSIKSDLNSSNSQNINWGINTDISVLPLENMEIFYQLDFKNNPLDNDARTSFWFMDAGIRYQPQKNMEIELKAHNITNIHVITNTTYREMDTFTTSYNLRPFNIMGSVKYSF